MIVMDSNERGNIEKYVECKKELLKYGDYTNERRSFLLERKTVDDFEQSLLNGHLHVQLENMMGFPGPTYLVVEGDIGLFISLEKRKGIRGFMTKFPYTIARSYGTQYIHTWDATETADVLKDLDKYIYERDEHKIKYEPIVVKGKTDRRLISLISVPRLGQKNAQLLLDHYGNVKSVILALETEPKVMMDICNRVGKGIIENMKKMFIYNKIYNFKKRNIKKIRKYYTRKRAIYNKRKRNK